MTSAPPPDRRPTARLATAWRPFALLVAGYLALWLPALWWPAYLDTPFGLVAAVPFLSVYVFHLLGVPGLLEHNGACGWGWCAPTPFGWAFVIGFWLILAGLVAWLLASRADDAAPDGP